MKKRAVARFLPYQPGKECAILTRAHFVPFVNNIGDFVMKGKWVHYLGAVVVVVVGIWVASSGYIPNPIAKKTA